MMAGGPAPPQCALMEAMMAQEKVRLELSRDEALVLFEWLARFNKADGRDFEDQAEQRVLWDMEAKLESVLVEPFDPKYSELLAQARARVRGPEERARQEAP
jgi:hypothetical protein